MANEFKIKTGLILGPSHTQPVIGIRDTSSSIISDASSILVTGKAIYDYVYSETQPLILDISVLDYRLDITDSSVSTLTLRLNTTDSSLNTLLGRHNITESSLGLLTNQVNIIDSSLNIVTLRLNITDSSLNILLNRHNITESSLGALTIRVTNAEASINSIDASTKFWKVYVDGSLAFRDSSIAYLSTRSANHDTSILLLNNWNISQDASIIRIDVSLNNTTDALTLFYEKSYIDGSFGLRDTSIANINNRLTLVESSVGTLTIRLNTTDTSLNTLLGRHNVTEASLGLLTSKVNIIDSSLYTLTTRVTNAEASINKIDASTKFWKVYTDGSLNTRDISINWLNVEKVNRSGDSMYGALDMSVNSINQILNLQFNTDPSVSYAEGKVSWNKNEHTININTGIDDVTIQAGLETLVSVWNDTGETIPNMTPVISNGSYNGYTTVIKAQANNRSINNLVGITTHDIEPSTMGFAAKSGKIRDGNTSMWNNGDLLYVSGDVSGGLTNIRPLPVKYPVNIARVEKSDASYGVIVMCNLTLEQNAARINAGGIQIGSFTDNSDGSVTIGAGLYNLFDASDFNGPLYTYEIDTCTFTLIDNSSNYIVADYNEGNPIYKLINNVEPINESTIVPAYTLFRDASCVTQIDWDDMALGLPNKLHQRFVKTNRFGRENGLEISEIPTRIIQVNGGIVWYGARRLTLDTVRSDTDSMQRWVKTGGVWGKTVVTQYENLYYQNGADVALIGNNKFGVVWIYRDSGNFPLIRFVLGTSSYNKLSEAQSAGIPADLPSVIRTNSILISRIIIKSGTSTSSEIKWAFTDLFTLEQSIPDHNDTLNKQGGLPNEYYHLSSAQYTDYVGKTYVDGSLSTLRIDINSSLGLYLLKSGGTMTGDLIINTSLNVLGHSQFNDVSILGNLDVSGAITSSSNVTGISTISAGLIVNDSQSGGAINDFIVNTDNYRAIDVSTINDSITIMNNELGKIGFFGSSPTVQSTGWDASGSPSDKTYVVSATTLNELAEVVGTLINELKLKGIIG